MKNSFLAHKDWGTALLLSRATIADIGKAVAYTNKDKELFLNTEDNLYKILPNFNEDMLKWLLWHEEYHGVLEHPKRYFKLLETEKDLRVTPAEVNIIMDILVHDEMRKKFPELVDIAKENLAQFRERNSLEYTFKTHTLEEMIKELSDAHKNDDDESEQPDSPDGDGSEDKDGKEGDGMGSPSGSKKLDSDGEKTGKRTPTKGKSDKGGKEEGESESKKTSPSGEPGDEQEPADWSKLEDIDDEEFIDEAKSQSIHNAVEKLRRRKIKLGQLTQQLNGLASTKMQRTYRTPSHIHVQDGVILKGKQPGFAKLYLVFDASGSMSRELTMFKEIIEHSIPQALNTPTEWFSGYAYDESERAKLKELRNPEGRGHDYYKGKFSDIMPVHASGGYDDDCFRTLELCLKAEQAGYSPIGVTDGGGCWDGRTKELAQKLKRTIIVSSYKSWINFIKRSNPGLDVIDVNLDED